MIFCIKIWFACVLIISLFLVKGVKMMGFWYLLLLLIGIVFIIVGLTKKGVSVSVKLTILLFVIGILIIVGSVILLMPGSSDIISQLLKQK